jgi:hypothetical protein
MSMGKRRTESQCELWVSARSVAAPPGHPFYLRLNALLDKHGFDQFAETACRPYYAEVMGRPSLPPGVYFRMLAISKVLIPSAASVGRLPTPGRWGNFSGSRRRNRCRRMFASVRPAKEVIIRDYK